MVGFWTFLLLFLLYNFGFSYELLKEIEPNFLYRKIQFPEKQDIKKSFNYKKDIFAISYKPNTKKSFIYIYRNNKFKKIYTADATILNYAISLDSNLYFIAKKKIFLFKGKQLIEIKIRHNKLRFSKLNRPIIIDSNNIYFTYDNNFYFYHKGEISLLYKAKEKFFIKQYVYIGNKIFLLDLHGNIYKLEKKQISFLIKDVDNMWSKKNILYIQKANSIYSYKKKLKLTKKIEYNKVFKKIFPFKVNNIYLAKDVSSLYLINENIRKIIDISKLGFYINSLFIDEQNCVHVLTNSGYYIFPYLCISDFKFNNAFTKLKKVLRKDNTVFFIFLRNIIVIEKGHVFQLELAIDKNDIVRKAYLHDTFLYIISKKAITIYDLNDFSIVKRIKYNSLNNSIVMVKDTIFFLNIIEKKQFFISKDDFVLKKLDSLKFTKKMILVDDDICLVDNMLYIHSKKITLLPEKFYFSKAKLIRDGKKEFLFLLDNFFNLYFYFNNKLIKLRDIEKMSRLFFVFEKSFINIIGNQISIYIKNNLYLYEIYQDSLIFSDSLLNCSEVRYRNNLYYIAKDNKLFKYKKNKLEIFFNIDSKILDFYIDDKLYVLSNKYFFVLDYNGDIYQKYNFVSPVNNVKFVDKKLFYSKYNIYFYEQNEIWDFSSFLALNNSILSIHKIDAFYYIFTDFSILKIPIDNMKYFLAKPEFSIDSIFVNNQYVKFVGNRLDLGSGLKNISFVLSNRSTKSDFSTFISYGSRKDFISSNESEVVILNLGAGEYNLTFFVNGNNLFSTNNVNLRFKIFIDKYWWEKGEYIFLLFLLLSSGLFFIFSIVYKKRMENYKIESELRALSKMQVEILKSGNDYINEVEVELFYFPYFKAGGDFYDIKKISDKHFLFTVGDISGHGLNSSLITAQIKTIFNFYKEELLDVNFIFSKINDFLIKMYSYDYYLTMIYIIVDLENYKLHISSAGHPFPLLFNNIDNKLSYIEGANSFPLGMIAMYKAKQQSIDVRQGDILCLYTDGIFENHSKNKKFFLTQKEFVSILYPYLLKGVKLNSLKLSVVKEIKKHYPKKRDDETLLFVKIK